LELNLQISLFITADSFQFVNGIEPIETSDQIKAQMGMVNIISFFENQLAQSLLYE